MVLSVQIPQDIIDSIIYLLHDDTHTLKTCAVVSRSFLPPCRQQIFFVVHLDHPFLAQKHCQRMFRLLNKNPDIGFYIKVLRVYVYDSTSSHDGALIPWIAGEKTFLAVIRLLPQLRSLMLTSCWPMDWLVFPGTLRAGMLDLFRSPNLTDLKLDRIGNLPMHYFSTFSQLKRLSLLRIYFDNGQCPGTHSALPIAVPKKKGGLKSLEMWRSNECGRSLVETLSHPQSLLDISELRELSIRGQDPEFMDIVWEVVRTAAQSLECFIWRFIVWNREGTLVLCSTRQGVAESILYFSPETFTARVVDLSVTSNLRFLIIETPFLSSKCDPLAWLASTLDRLNARDNPLEELVILVDSTVDGSNHTSYDHSIRELCQYSVWSEIDTILANTRFPFLRKVDVFVDIPGPHVHVSQGSDYIRKLEERMPLLHATKVLRVMRKHYDVQEIHKRVSTLVMP